MRRPLWVSAVSAVLVLATAGAPRVPAAATEPGTPMTVLVVDGEPGAALLDNGVVVLRPESATLEAGWHFERHLTVIAYGPGHSPWWFVGASTAPGVALARGSFVGMQQSPPADVTALSLTGDSQTCARAASTFTIHEVDGPPETPGPVTALALSFEYHCEGEFPAVYGEVRINSAVPLAALRALEPTTRFDAVAVGQQAPSRTVTLENIGTVDQAPQVRLTGMDADAFATLADGCTGVTLPPGGTCTIQVGFSPARSGMAHATLSILDDTPRGVREVRLEGTTP